MLDEHHTTLAAWANKLARDLQPIEAIAAHYLRANRDESDSLDVTSGNLEMHCRTIREALDHLETELERWGS